MAKKRKVKKNPALLGRWILALAIILVLMTGLAISLQQMTDTPSEPIQVILADNPYGAEDFGYRGDYLTCLTGESLLGIDVSSHQGVIDWQQVQSAGVEFVFVRLGYRGYMNESLQEDIYARENLRSARAAGLQVGAYFFSQAITEEEAREEARFALEILDGFQLDLPLTYDWEYVSDTARTANVTKEQLMHFTHTFCAMVEQAGYAPMVYFNKHLAQTHLELAELSDYPFWLAMYTDQMTYPYRVDFWQYSDSGRVPGIEANVDLNLWMPRNEV